MKIKKIISITLVCAMVLQLCSFTAFAGTGNVSLQEDKDSYVAFGDSITAGYKVGDDYKGYYDDDSWKTKNFGHDNCFVSLLSKKLNMDYTNYAIVGMRTEGLGNMLTGIASGEGTQELTMAGEKIVIDNNKEYENISNAKVISVNIGSNDISMSGISIGYLLKDCALANLIYDAAKKSLQGEPLTGDAILKFFADQNINPAEGMNQIQKSLSKENIEAYLTTVNDSAKIGSIFDDALQEYKDDYETIINNIRNINANATLAVVGLYNPYNKDMAKAQIMKAILLGEDWIGIGGDTEGFRALLLEIIKKAALSNADKATLRNTLNKEVTEMKAIELDMENEVALQGDEEVDAVQEANDFAEIFNLLRYLVYYILLSDQIDGMMNEMNQAVTELIEDDAKAVFVDTTGTTVPLFKDAHPDEAGDIFIANQIYNAVTCTVNAWTGFGGSITDYGYKNYILGDIATYAITPANNYAIDKVYVDGNIIPQSAYGMTQYDGISFNADNSLNISNITQDHSVYVTFKYAPSNTKKQQSSNIFLQRVLSLTKLFL